MMMIRLMFVLLAIVLSAVANAENKTFQANWTLPAGATITQIAVLWEKNGNNITTEFLSGDAVQVSRSVDVANGDVVSATITPSNTAGSGPSITVSATASGVNSPPPAVENATMTQLD